MADLDPNLLHTAFRGVEIEVACIMADEAGDGHDGTVLDDAEVLGGEIKQVGGYVFGSKGKGGAVETPEGAGSGDDASGALFGVVVICDGGRCARNGCNGACSA